MDYLVFRRQTVSTAKPRTCFPSLLHVTPQAVSEQTKDQVKTSRQNSRAVAVVINCTPSESY